MQNYDSTFSTAEATGALDLDQVVRDQLGVLLAVATQSRRHYEPERFRFLSRLMTSRAAGLSRLARTV